MSLKTHFDGLKINNYPAMVPGILNLYGGSMLKKSFAIALLGIAFSLFPSMNSFAETTEADISGNNDAISIITSDDIYRTEYDTEYYEDTCSREVYDGTTTDCSTNYETRCEKVPEVGPVCHQEETSSSCTSRPV